MRPIFNFLRYSLLICGFLLILPHLFTHYGIKDIPLISDLEFSSGWIIGLMLCLLGFGYPSQQRRHSSGDGSGPGWTSSDKDGFDGGGFGGDGGGGD